MIFRIQYACGHNDRRPYVRHNALSFRPVKHHLNGVRIAAFVIYSEHEQVAVVEFVTHLVVRNVRLCRRAVAHELHGTRLVAVRFLRRIRHRQAVRRAELVQTELTIEEEHRILIVARTQISIRIGFYRNALNAELCIHLVAFKAFRINTDRGKRISLRFRTTSKYYVCIAIFRRRCRYKAHGIFTAFIEIT